MKVLAVGTYTERNAPHVTAKQELGEGIYLYFWQEDGRGEELLHLEKLVNPSYLEFYGRRMFAVSERENHAVLAEYMLETTGGRINLKRLGGLCLEGAASCHIELCGETGMLFLSDYGSGDLKVIDVRKEGEPRLLQEFYFEGRGVRQARQEASHIHSCCAFEGKLYAADLGGDKIYQFEMGEEGLEGLRTIPARAGAGPRHMQARQENGVVTLYVINELDCTVSVYQERDGKGMCEIQWIPLLGQKRERNMLAADLRLSRDGFLYASVRGSNHIYVLKIEQDGRLCLIQEQENSGEWTRSICMDPAQKYLIAANQISGTLTVFERIKGRLLGPVRNVRTPVPVKVTVQEVEES